MSVWLQRLFWLVPYPEPRSTPPSLQHSAMPRSGIPMTPTSRTLQEARAVTAAEEGKQADDNAFFSPVLAGGGSRRGSRSSSRSGTTPRAQQPQPGGADFRNPGRLIEADELLSRLQAAERGAAATKRRQDAEAKSAAAWSEARDTPPPAAVLRRGSSTGSRRRVQTHTPVRVPHHAGSTPMAGPSPLRGAEARQRVRGGGNGRARPEDGAGAPPPARALPQVPQSSSPAPMLGVAGDRGLTSQQRRRRGTSASRRREGSAGRERGPSRGSMQRVTSASSMRSDYSGGMDAPISARTDASRRSSRSSRSAARGLSRESSRADMVGAQISPSRGPPHLMRNASFSSPPPRHSPQVGLHGQIGVGDDANTPSTVHSSPALAIPAHVDSPPPPIVCASPELAAKEFFPDDGSRSGTPQLRRQGSAASRNSPAGRAPSKPLPKPPSRRPPQLLASGGRLGESADALSVSDMLTDASSGSRSPGVALLHQYVA